MAKTKKSNTNVKKDSSITIAGNKYSSLNLYLNKILNQVSVKYVQIYDAKSNIKLNRNTFRDIDTTVDTLESCIKSLKSVKDKYPKVLLIDGKENVKSKIDDILQYVSYYNSGSKQRYGAILNLKHAAKKMAISYFVKEESDCDRFKKYATDKFYEAQKAVSKSNSKLIKGSDFVSFHNKIKDYKSAADKQKSKATANKNKINTAINVETGYTALKTFI